MGTITPVRPRLCLWALTLPVSAFADELIKDAAHGTRIATMILTDTNNVTLAQEVLTFGDDIVTSVALGATGPDQSPTENVTVDYETLTTTIIPGGNPAATPEPSSLLLLGTGLLNGPPSKTVRIGFGIARRTSECVGV